jgi:serine/threonine protein kinase
MIGQTISQYKILEKLGEGGMGIVYKAEDTKLGRIVALKFLPQGLGSHEPERARFLQEAQSASALNHPNICTVHDLQEFAGQYFIIMEYIDGKTLRQMIPIPKLQDAIGYAIQIGEALQEAHSKGVVHRDIKTDNIMVNSRNQIKVMDFGLAKLKGSLKITKTSSTVGTLAYMAPEQLQGGEIDARSDIFSMGVVLYELLTGNLPFEAMHEAAMMYAILNEAPQPVQKYLPGVSSELIHILNRALEKDPEDRYQTVHDMLIDLRRVKKETSRVSLTSIVPSTSELDQIIVTAEEKLKPVRGPKKPRKVLWWIGLPTFFILIAVILFFIILPSHTPQLNSDMSFRTLEIPFVQIYYPDLSPDGNWVSFAACDANNEWAIYFMNVAKGNPLRLTKEPIQASYNSDISPDASEILYDREPPGGMRGIYIVSSAGGTGRKIAEPGTLAKWSPDGRLIGYCLVGRGTVPSQSGKREFWTVKPDGSDNHLEFVDTLCYSWTNFCFDWSPDGNSIAWLRGFPGYSEIIIHDLKTGKERQLTHYQKPIDELVWATNGQVFFTSSKGGNTNVWMIPASGGEAVQVTRGSGPDLGVKVSSNGKRLLFQERRQFCTLWTANINGSDVRQLTFDNQYLEMPSYSPDKQRISFDMSSSDILRFSTHIFTIQTDGTNRTQLTAGDAQYYNANWSPDGKYMTYASKQVDEPLDSSRVYLIEVENPGTPRLFGKGFGAWWIDAEKFVTVIPRILPHPHTILYSVHNSEPIEVSDDSTLQIPLHDNKHIVVCDFRTARKGWWLETVGLEKSKTSKQILSAEYLDSSFPSVNLHYILYKQENGEVWRVSLPDGKQEKLPDILHGINPYAGNIQLSTDDQQLVYLKGQLEARLVLIENVFK